MLAQCLRSKVILSSAEYKFSFIGARKKQNVVFLYGIINFFAQLKSHIFVLLGWRAAVVQYFQNIPLHINNIFIYCHFLSLFLVVNLPMSMTVHIQSVLINLPLSISTLYLIVDVFDVRCHKK